MYHLVRPYDWTSRQVCAGSSDAITLHSTPDFGQLVAEASQTAFRLRNDIQRQCCHKGRWPPGDEWHGNTVRKLSAAGIVSSKTEGMPPPCRYLDHCIASAFS